MILSCELVISFTVPPVPSPYVSLFHRGFRGPGLASLPQRYRTNSLSLFAVNLRGRSEVPGRHDDAVRSRVHSAISRRVASRSLGCPNHLRHKVGKDCKDSPPQCILWG
jgi:hypothetical protein